MSASEISFGNKLEDDVAAVLGMRKDVFQKQPNLFLVTHAYFKGDRARILSAVAAGSGSIILVALFVGFMSFSPFRPTSTNHLRIDLSSDLAKPHAKAFVAVLPSERSRAPQRSKIKAVAAPSANRTDGDTLQQTIKSVPPYQRQHLVQEAGQSQWKTGGSLNEASQAGLLETNGNSHSPDIDAEQPGLQGGDLSPVRSATSAGHITRESPDIIDKALYNRRAGIDALRALRHQ
jgi:hypothetical protein